MTGRELANLFQLFGYEWNFSDGTRIPNAEEIDKTIDAAKKALEGAEDNTQVEVGRLIVKRKGHFHDVYMLVAEQRVIDEA